jgi:hypothetical protein
MKDKSGDNNKYYLGVVLLFTTTQVMIGIFQLIQSSMNSNNKSAEYFGYFGAISVGILMFAMYKEIKKL